MDRDFEAKQARWEAAARDVTVLRRELGAAMAYEMSRHRDLLVEGLNPRTALLASAQNALHRDAPAWVKSNERICAKWGITPRLSNSILLDTPLQSRTLTAGAVTGSYLVEVGNQLSVTPAHDTVGSIFSLMNVTTAAGAAGNQIVGKLETLPTATVLADESSSIAEEDAAAGQALLTPKNIGTFQKYSRQWALQSEAGPTQLLQLHTNAAKSKLLQQILEGTGADGELEGLTVNSDVPTAAGTSIDMAKVCTAVESVEAAGTGPFAWVVSASAAKLLRQRAVISGGSGILADQRIAGYPVFVTGCTTSALAVFGSWSDLQVFQWRPLELALDPYTDFQTGIVAARSWITADAAPQLVKSFYTLTAIT